MLYAFVDRARHLTCVIKMVRCLYIIHKLSELVDQCMKPVIVDLEMTRPGSM